MTAILDWLLSEPDAWFRLNNPILFLYESITIDLLLVFDSSTLLLKFPTLRIIELSWKLSEGREKDSGSAPKAGDNPDSMFTVRIRTANFFKWSSLELT
jgi:hypothetical protein